MILKISESEIEDIRKNFNELEKLQCLNVWKFNVDTDRAEWKIQLTKQNSCISTKCFEQTRTIYKKSEPIEIFMGSNTEDVIDELFNTLLQRFQRAQETSNERGSNLFLIVLNFYIIIIKE